jgi:hypothetical protein
MPFRRGATPRAMARPQAGHPVMASRGGTLSRRIRLAAGWTGALVLIGVVAFIVGRPGQDAGVLGATPSASVRSPLPVVFGTAIDGTSGEAAKRTTSFRRGDTFVYSVRLAEPVGATSVYVEVLRDSGGTLTQLQAPTRLTTVANRSVIAKRVTVTSLVDAFGTGSFVLRIYLDPSRAPIAAGKFSIVP